MEVKTSLCSMLQYNNTCAQTLTHILYVSVLADNFTRETFSSKEGMNSSVSPSGSFSCSCSWNVQIMLSSISVPRGKKCGQSLIESCLLLVIEDMTVPAGEFESSVHGCLSVFMWLQSHVTFPVWGPGIAPRLRVLVGLSHSSLLVMVTGIISTWMNSLRHQPGSCFLVVRGGNGENRTVGDLFRFKPRG